MMQNSQYLDEYRLPSLLLAVAAIRSMARNDLRKFDVLRGGRAARVRRGWRFAREKQKETSR
jgi:hypothetical protein